ncbi:hypothetical protein C0993_009900 [Termitomyces sp. T159_Od127]|nr:hypothetical protein C0993_009900 [Termitomyces sp. T159_Od127]
MINPKLAATVLGLLACSPLAIAFNPREYAKHVATCKAINRSRSPSPETVDIEIRYVDVDAAAGAEKKSMIMVHGWPSLWSSWARQIDEFKNDYRVVVPDLRGFGGSTHPGDARASGDMGDMVGDLVCVLERARIEKALCMGHDWGAQVCYEAARMRPDMFVAVVGAVVPYIPAAGPFVPVKHLVPVFPRLAYQIYFDAESDAAVAELDRDIRRTVRATLRTVASPPPDAYLRSTDSFLDAWNEVDEIPPVPFFSAEEEDYFVEQFSLQGFKPTLQFYTTENRRASRDLAHRQGNFTIPVPALAVYPLDDPVADWKAAADLLKTADYVPELTTKVRPRFCASLRRH